jgi:uncharacterized protein YjbI with pentapeptide repeats
LFHLEASYTKLNATTTPLEKGEYEMCVFKSCEFSSADLANCTFVECEFIDCNLSLAKFYGSTIRDGVFRNCKLLGVRFDACNPIGLSFRFDGCVLTHASFHKTIIKKTRFENCALTDVDFTECDLTEAVFDGCDLARATFERTNLEKADFRTAMNVVMDPEVNKLSKAKFSLQGLPGLLGKYGVVVSG